MQDTSAEDSVASAVNDCYMREPQVPNPPKRQRPEQRALQLNGSTEPLSKRQKLSYPATGSQPPAAFWDNLSKIALTKRALRELDRRNTLSAPSHRRPHRPLTRSEVKRSRRPTQSAIDFLHSCTPECSKDIQLFNRHGGPDLTDLRGYPELINPLVHPMSSSQSPSRGRKRDPTSTSNTRPTTRTTNTKSTGPYDRGFQQNLIDGGVYPHAYEYPDGKIPAKPNNWEEINERLARPRPSLSPSRFSEEAHEKFLRADAHAFKEKQITTSVIPIIEGHIQDTRCVSGGIPFTNLNHLTDGTLVPGNPDIYYGARPEQLDRQVRNELSGYIIPSTQHDLPLVPNFFVAVKGPDGSAAVAKRQACYDGALGARGVHRLQSYSQQDPSFDKNAYCISVTYHDGTLKIFTSYSTQLAGDRPEYLMHQISAWAMTGNVETFRQGATYYRNGRDWAKEQRDTAIERANERMNERHTGALAIDTGIIQAFSFVSEESGTSTVEALSEESRTFVTKDSNTTTHLQELEVFSDELTMDRSASFKRSLNASGLPQSGRKRRNVSDSDNLVLEPQSSEHSGLSQRFENQALEQEPSGRSSHATLQPIIQETTTVEKPPSKKKGKEKHKV